MMNPKTKMWLLLAVTTLLIGLALFLAAGTVDYWQAWIYLAVSTASSVPVTLTVRKDPVLLEGRTKAGPTAEKRAIQKIIVLCIWIPWFAVFIVPALDRRFGWSNVPWWFSLSSDLLIITSMWMVSRVFKENRFGSAAVEITQNQRVISTGPYAVVRHPMYSSASLYFVGTSVALGSYWGLIASVLIVFGLVWRLFDEEKFLAQNLPGYADYCATVHWRLVPGVF
jgi:protein-S-isoprenylcysteine O-methyltransferase Ste14